MTFTFPSRSVWIHSTTPYTSRAPKYAFSTFCHPNKNTLNIRLFECTKEDLNDVEIMESKKAKEIKEDPRLALMRRRQLQ